MFHEIVSRPSMSSHVNDGWREHRFQWTREVEFGSERKPTYPIEAHRVEPAAIGDALAGRNQPQQVRTNGPEPPREADGLRRPASSFPPSARQTKIDPAFEPRAARACQPRAFASPRTTTRPPSSSIARSSWSALEGSSNSTRCRSKPSSMIASTYAASCGGTPCCTSHLRDVGESRPHRPPKTGRSRVLKRDPRSREETCIAATKEQHEIVVVNHVRRLNELRGVHPIGVVHEELRGAPQKNVVKSLSNGHGSPAISHR